MEQDHPQEHEAPGMAAVVATPASLAQARAPKLVEKKARASEISPGDMDSEIKEVALKDNLFLLGLTDRGMTYQDYSPDTVIKIAARVGDHGDWAAYFLTPPTPFGDVLNYGNKLPEQAAKELFPEWAKRGLNWRA